MGTHLPIWTGLLEGKVSELRHFWVFFFFCLCCFVLLCSVMLGLYSVLRRLSYLWKMEKGKSFLSIPFQALPRTSVYLSQLLLVHMCSHLCFPVQCSILHDCSELCFILNFTWLFWVSLWRSSHSLMLVQFSKMWMLISYVQHFFIQFILIMFSSTPNPPKLSPPTHLPNSMPFLSFFLEKNQNRKIK